MILYLAVYILTFRYICRRFKLQVYKLQNITQKILSFCFLMVWVLKKKTKKNQNMSIYIPVHVFSDLRTKTRMILMHLKFELLSFWMFITILVPLAGVMHINILILITISKSSKKEVDSKADCFLLVK